MFLLGTPTTLSRIPRTLPEFFFLPGVFLEFCFRSFCFEFFESSFMSLFDNGSRRNMKPFWVQLAPTWWVLGAQLRLKLRQVGSKLGQQVTKMPTLDWPPRTIRSRKAATSHQKIKCQRALRTFENWVRKHFDRFSVEESMWV